MPSGCHKGDGHGKRLGLDYKPFLAFSHFVFDGKMSPKFLKRAVFDRQVLKLG